MAKTSSFGPQSLGVSAFPMAKQEWMERILALKPRNAFSWEGRHKAVFAVEYAKSNT